MSAIGCEVNGTVDLATTHSIVAKNIIVKSVVTTETQPIVEMENTHKIAALMNEFRNMIPFFFCFYFSFDKLNLRSNPSTD